MPVIAQGVLRDGATFYWHLGDYRRIEAIDEDIANEPEHRTKPLTMDEYLGMAWQDFIDNQISWFGKLPVFLTLGNHETTYPKTRADLLPQFAGWFNAPAIEQQRLRDDPRDHLLKFYYRWIERGVVFYALDNATTDQFSDDQMTWFERSLASDAGGATVLAVVVGMHEALPDGIASDHAMDASVRGVVTGRRIYGDLARFAAQTHKRVYILASHQHYFMDGIFNTDYLKQHGGVLPGWIVGTGGAQRYALSPDWQNARAAETNVYGYLLGTVRPSGEIQFVFKHLSEKDVPATVVNRYRRDFVHWCFAENTEVPSH